jgi:hypothetical protein
MSDQHRENNGRFAADTRGATPPTPATGHATRANYLAARDREVQGDPVWDAYVTYRHGKIVNKVIEDHSDLFPEGGTWYRKPSSTEFERRVYINPNEPGVIRTLEFSKDFANTYRIYVQAGSTPETLAFETSTDEEIRY